MTRAWINSLIRNGLAYSRDLVWNLSQTKIAALLSWWPRMASFSVCRKDLKWSSTTEVDQLDIVDDLWTL